jgi:hypothetical protein
VAEQLLAPGETLNGYCVATRRTTFSGGVVAIVVTDKRLVVQPLNRKMEANGDPISLDQQNIAAISAGGGGGGWWTVSAAIMDNVSIDLKIRTANGEKLKLMLMRGEGGIMGPLGGGETQKQGVQALSQWFAQQEQPSDGQ